MEVTLTSIQEASQWIRQKLPVLPDIGLILGSGLGDLAEEIQDPVYIDYNEIPHFPVSTVSGHKGRLVIGKLEGKQVLAMQGRFHYYEGYSMQTITFPVRVMRALGIQTLLVTNACGGLNPDYHAGGLMILKDHINFMGDNPLIGKNHAELGPRFPDLSHAYDPELRALAKRVGARLGIEPFEGVYLAISGPNYLSKAELNMVRLLGADTLGMSTVPEVLVAAHGGMRVLGISCITDMAIPEALESISHEQVMAMAQEAKPRFIKLIKGILNEVTLP